tara:strand:+ start:2661 stop:2993 length:333 start_codon:yes stop_codon:yes gene_type:complete
MNEEKKARLIKAHDISVEASYAIWEKIIKELTGSTRMDTKCELPLTIGLHYMTRTQELKEGLAVNEFKKVDTLGEGVATFTSSVNYIELHDREFEVSKGNNGDVYLMRTK